MERDEYVATLVDFLELLPPTMIVERISGDAPPDYFIGPDLVPRQAGRAVRRWTPSSPAAIPGKAGLYRRAGGVTPLR